jgi:hypothetical protein
MIGGLSIDCWVVGSACCSMLVSGLNFGRKKTQMELVELYDIEIENESPLSVMQISSNR